MSLTELSVDCLLEVFRWLDAKSLGRLCITCKFIRDIVADRDNLWEKLIDYHFGDLHGLNWNEQSKVTYKVSNYKYLLKVLLTVGDVQGTWRLTSPHHLPRGGLVISKVQCGAVVLKVIDGPEVEAGTLALDDGGNANGRFLGHEEPMKLLTMSIDTCGRVVESSHSRLDTYTSSGELLTHAYRLLTMQQDSNEGSVSAMSMITLDVDQNPKITSFVELLSHTSDQTADHECDHTDADEGVDCCRKARKQRFISAAQQAFRNTDRNVIGDPIEYLVVQTSDSPHLIVLERLTRHCPASTLSHIPPQIRYAFRETCTAAYGSHGYEVLQPFYMRANQAHHNVNFPNLQIWTPTPQQCAKIICIKVIGDPNVPSGRASFIADFPDELPEPDEDDGNTITIGGLPGTSVNHIQLNMSTRIWESWWEQCLVQFHPARKAMSLNWHGLIAYNTMLLPE